MKKILSLLLLLPLWLPGLAQEYTLQCVVSPQYAGSVSYSKAEQVTAGQQYSLYTSPREGFKFVAWKDEAGKVVSTKTSFYYTMPSRNVVLTAQYEYSPNTPADPELPKVSTAYKLYGQVFPPYSGSTNIRNAGEEYEAYEQPYIYANPRTGFRFVDWRDDTGQLISTEQYFYYTMPDRDVTLTANFEYMPDTPGNPLRNYFDSETGRFYIDDFTTGHLYDAGREYFDRNDLSREDVSEVIVIGKVDDYYDAAYTGYFSSSAIDLSRTTGLTNFRGLYESSSIASLKLPETVNEIYYWVFSDMEQLTSLTLYSYEPPTVSEYLTLDKDKVTVFVPGAALGLYAAHPVWGQYVLLPLADDVRDVTVNLPPGVNPTDYANCYVDLVNTKSGQRMGYLVTDASSFTFFSVIRNTSWSAYLHTADGMVLGEITGIEVKDDDVDVTFGTLKRLHTLTATVTGEGGKSLTAEATIQWLTADGEFLTQGTELAGQPDGREIVARASVSGYLYQPIAEKAFTVGEAPDAVSFVALLRPMATVNVKVTDTDGNAIGGAMVTLTQNIGKDAYAVTAATAADGSASLKAFTGFDASVSGQKSSYISQTSNVTADHLSSTVLLQLSKLAGTEIRMIATATQAVPAGTTPIVIKAEGIFAAVFEYVNYSLYDKTAKRDIPDYGRTGDTFALASSLTDGTQVQVTASLPGTLTLGGLNLEVDPVVGVATISGGKGEVHLDFVQRGGISATINSDADVPALLFDADGKLYQQKAFKKSNVAFYNLPDGEYAFVVVMRPDITATIGSLDRLDDMGLSSGLDYYLQKVTVKCGVITILEPIRYVARIVQEPEFLNEYSSFTVNKTECVIGNFITFSTELRFNDEVAAKISDVTLVYDLQANNNYVANTCMIGTSLTPVTYSGNELTVPGEVNCGRIRFCTIPNAVGTYTPSAYVKFRYEGKEYCKLIGSVTFDAKSLDIYVQPFTADGIIMVSGMAPASSTVDIYDGDVFIGRTNTRPDGRWMSRVTLVGGEGTHYVHAEVSNIVTAPGTRLITETKESVWDSKMILPIEAGFQFYNAWMRKTVKITQGLLDCMPSESSYMFYTESEFTFWVRLTAHGPEKLEQVIINAWLESGDVLSMTAYYDATSDLYVTTHTFGWGDLPVSLSVDWRLKGETRVVIDHTFVPATPCVTVLYRPIHDPSGYVYEAVGSNRMEGVTATALYKEQYEDIYGDPQERVAVWDAENYGQVNPQLTDAEGVYHWDVPQGLWQVKLEKPGYETTYSEWLPVPPPQMEVNLPMQQLVPPTVKTVRAYDDMLEVDFSLYMESRTLTADSIHVTLDGKVVEGTVELLDAEASPVDGGEVYASRVRFIPSKAGALGGQGTLAVIVSRQVKAYNGLIMGQAYQQTLKAVKRPKDIEVSDTVDVFSGREATIALSVLPAEAAAGKKVTALIASEDMVKVETTEITLDSNGQATLSFTAALPGTTTITWQVDDSSLSAETVVIVLPMVPGDINADGVSDVADIACVIGVMAGTNSYRNADVNGDGIIDVADIATIITYMASGSDE